jgi:hypothetical protein
MSKINIKFLSENTSAIFLSIVVFILAYAFMKPSVINYYFDTIVGRLILVVFILSICSFSSLAALLTLITIIYIANINTIEGFKSGNDVNTEKKNTVKNSISSIEGTSPAPVGGFIIDQVNTVPKPIVNNQKPKPKPKPKRGKKINNINTRESMLNVEETLRSKESKKMFIHNDNSGKEPTSYDPVENSSKFSDVNI